MTNDRFCELVENHDDIMMHCGDFKFIVMTCYDQLLICERNTEKERYYDTIDDMLDKYRIKGEPLRLKLKDVVLESCA